MFQKEERKKKSIQESETGAYRRGGHNVITHIHAFSFRTCAAFLCFLAAGLSVLLIFSIPPR